MMHPNLYAKAVIGALVAGLGALSTALTTGDNVNPQEWVGVILAAVVAFGGVYLVPNRPAPAKRPEAGQSALYVLLIVLVVVLILFLLGFLR